MWKSLDRFWAQIDPFEHILASKIADIHCAAMELAIFRMPYLAELREKSTGFH
jgi:hypothetical protein